MPDFKVSGAKFFDEIELDESYFGAKRVRGKRGRSVAGKTPVFGMKKRKGGVYVEIVKNCSKDELMLTIQSKILENSTIHTDGWIAYDGLILNEYNRYRVFHSHNEFARGKSHVNGIEAFILHLKEYEFWYSNREFDLYQILLKMIRKNPN